ncbi:hypothetical protein C9417_08615 [Rhizobium sp. SEMIA 4088]|nr:hypothetical protein C9417_08615 [Rhizobium sp. SEMIA 4088]
MGYFRFTTIYPLKRRSSKSGAARQQSSISSFTKAIPGMLLYGYRHIFGNSPRAGADGRRVATAPVG